MAASLRKLAILLCFVNGSLTSRTHHYTPPDVPRLTDLFTSVSLVEGFSHLFGTSNVHITSQGSQANLVLNNKSGSGLISKNAFNHGFFSAAIKLPSGFTSGVVVAYYLSNGDSFPHNHDEIDMELLGRDRTKEWVLQTNIYANGLLKIGREEKFYLWFDPTEQFHHYSIIWNNNHIVFFVDNIPVRETLRVSGMTLAYPGKPMSVYLTIWDGSKWATHGGKYPVDYRYAPFIASFSRMEMVGCVVSPGTSTPPARCPVGASDLDPVGGGQFISLSPPQVEGLRWAREKLMFYSYCMDKERFMVLPPECSRTS